MLQAALTAGPDAADTLARARAGDQAAFAELVGEYQGMVFGLAHHFLHHQAEAEELAQDVFVALHQNLSRMESPTHLTFWLRQVTRIASTSASAYAPSAQLKEPGWSRIISVREKGELTEIYTWTDGKAPGGLAIIAAEPQELTVVNLVGQINMAQLGALQGQLGIPGLTKAK